MAKETVVTEKGLKELQDRLQFLKTTQRKHVGEQLAYARSLGDLSENSEYDEAKDLQFKTEQEIEELEEKLKNVRIISEKDINTTVVNLGNDVRIRYDDGEEEDISIVGSTETDALNNKYSDSSPLGKALMGRQVGDEVTVVAPKSQFTVTILSISKSGN